MPPGAQPTSCPAGQLGGPADPLLRLIVEARSYEAHRTGAGPELRRSCERARILCIASLRPKRLLKVWRLPSLKHPGTNLLLA